MTRALALAAGAAALVLGLACPAAADAERMVLACQDGRTIERSNGSSWWGVDHEAVYTTEHLLITGSDGEVHHEKSYGRKGNGARSTCVAEHFGSTWTVDLVRTR